MLRYIDLLKILTFYDGDPVNDNAKQSKRAPKEERLVTRGSSTTDRGQSFHGSALGE